MTNLKTKKIEEFFATVMKSGRFLDKIIGFSHNDKTTTMLQGQTFVFLRANPKSTVGNLADELHMSSSSAAQLTDRLAEDKLIIREHDEDDRRIVKLSLTKKGIELDNRMKSIFFEKIERIFKDITEKEFEELIRLHTKLLEVLKKQSSTI